MRGCLLGRAALLWVEPCTERTLGKLGNTASIALLWVEPFATQTLGRLGKPPERSGTTQSEAVLPRVHTALPRAKRLYPFSPEQRGSPHNPTPTKNRSLPIREAPKSDWVERPQTTHYHKSLLCRGSDTSCRHLP